MTDYTYRVALIVPAAQVEAARRIAAAMGWGEGCFSAAISANGAAPATHWGLSAAATQSFIDSLDAAAAGDVPAGCAPEDIAAVLPVLLSSIAAADASPVAQFDSLAASNGLLRIRGGE